MINTTIDEMIIFSRKNIFLVNIVVGILVLLFIILRLHNTGVIQLPLRSISIKNIQKSKKTLPTVTAPLKIPWRFHIEEDGFVFPKRDDKVRYITYERLNSSWAKQILQFENANIFAYLLKRTLLVPPLSPHKSVPEINIKANTSKEDSVFMSEIIDFDLLSSMVTLGVIDTAQVEKMSLMERYNVCHDPRLGFWLDYIPSVENIQTWRLLKEQYFSPLKLNLLTLNNEKQFVCPGTYNYFDRWGPPLHVKALYRGILSELHKRDEDLIYFQGDTLDTTHIRFFDKQRTKKAQELLLFYIRFSKTITKQIKKLAKLLGHGYTAVLANHITTKDDGIPMYIANEVQRLRLNNSARNVLIVTNLTKRYLFNELERHDFNLVFSEEFIEHNIDKKDKKFLSDKIHLLSLLLCAYSTNFIGLPGTSDLYFVEHLRLQDTKMTDGLITDKVSVRWAKRTTRDKADEHKIILKPVFKTTTTFQTIRRFQSANQKLNISIMRKDYHRTKTRKLPKPKKRLDRLHSIACNFCNYVRYVTGQHGCPSLKHIC